MARKDFVKMYVDWLLFEIRNNELMREEKKTLAKNNIDKIMASFDCGYITVNEAMRFLNNDIFKDASGNIAD